MPERQTHLTKGQRLGSVADPAPFRLVGRPAALGFRNYLHVAARTELGQVRYAAWSASDAPVSYRPGEWSQSVVYDVKAVRDPLLYADVGALLGGAVSDGEPARMPMRYGPYLYLVWGTSVAARPELEFLAWRYKRSI